MKQENTIAYAEVLEILRYIPKKYYDLIPKSVINKMLKNYDETHDFVYNAAIPLEKQSISIKAKEILKYFDETYWKNGSSEVLGKSSYDFFSKATNMTKNNEIIKIPKKSWFRNIYEKIKHYIGHLRKKER